MDTFKVGDDIAVVVHDRWSINAGLPTILYRGKVIAVHKTGHVITERGKFRQNGSPIRGFSGIETLMHLTQELEDENKRREEMNAAKQALFRLETHLAHMRKNGESLLALHNTLQQLGVFDALKLSPDQ